MVLGRLETVCGIQARCGSTRLPRKVLADLAGAPMIQRVVDRARSAREVEHVVVLTSDDPTDDLFCDSLEARGIAFRRGPLDDVLGRYLALMDEYLPRYLVRVTADCPLIDPDFIDRQVQALRRYDADFTWVAPGGIGGTLCGQGALSARALARARQCEAPEDREHVGSFFFQRERDRFRHVELCVEDELRQQGLRLTVDEAPDLELIQRIFEHFAPEHGSLVPLTEVLAWLRQNPNVASLNGSVVESEANLSLVAERERQPLDLVGRFQ